MPFMAAFPVSCTAWKVSPDAATETVRVWPELTTAPLAGEVIWSVGWAGSPLAEAHRIMIVPGCAAAAGCLGSVC